MYRTTLTLQHTPAPAEAKGRNGYCKLDRLSLWLPEAVEGGRPHYTLRLEGYAKRSGWNPPVTLEISNTADIRALAEALLNAADTIDSKAEGPSDQPDWTPTKAQNPAFTCRKCGSDNVWYRQTVISIPLGVAYHCRACNRRWWMVGRI